MRLFGLVVLAGYLFAAPAQAQSGMVRASDPAGLVRLLESKGLKSVVLSKDSYGDPTIDFELSGYQTSLVFYDCNEETHTGCTSLQLRAGFDREQPWTAAAAMDVARKLRFAAVWLDETGDPWVQWDIMTGSGIPADVFSESIDLFGETIDDVADMVFED